jgi:hypothetical protein
MRSHRIAATAALICFLLAFVELLGPGFPTSNDSAASIDAYFVDHRLWMLTAVLVQGLGNVVWTLFVCLLGWTVARAGCAAAALVGVAGGVLNVAISLTGLSCIAALAYGIAGTGAPAVSKAFFSVASMTLVVSNFMLALMAAGFAASTMLPKAFRVATVLAGVIFLMGGAALSRHGAFSPDGAIQFLSYGVELLWTLAAGVLLWRGRPAPGGLAHSGAGTLRETSLSPR